MFWIGKERPALINERVLASSGHSAEGPVTPSAQHCRERFEEAKWGGSCFGLIVLIIH